MNLTDVGIWLLPRLEAAIEDGIDWLFAFQLYVQRWREALEL